MGIILAVATEIVVSTIVAVTEAAEATAAIVTTAEFTEETALLGEVAADTAAEEAAAGVDVVVGEETEIIIQKCLANIEKLNKMISEFCVIDAVFKVAHKLLQNSSTQKSCDKSERLNKSLGILHKLQNKMTEISKWLEEHKDNTVVLEGVEVPLDAALLNKVMKPLSVALGSLEKLRSDVNNLSMNNQVISYAQIVSLDRSMIRIVATFQHLSAFKKEKSDKISNLASFPITSEEVNEWKKELDFEVDEALTVLNSERYKYPENV